MRVPRYHINLFWSDEDEAWIADVPDLGLGVGPRRDRRRRRSVGRGRREAAVAVLRETGAPVPEPRYRPAIYAVGRARDAA